MKELLVYEKITLSEDQKFVLSTRRQNLQVMINTFRPVRIIYDSLTDEEQEILTRSGFKVNPDSGFKPKIEFYGP